MKNNPHVSRRRFLRSTAGVGAAVALGSTFALGKSPTPEEIALKAANKKIRLAFIGVGPKGLDNLGDFQQVGITPVAVCDVDENYIEKALELAPDVAKYTDFREMLANEANNCDGVIVSTPDHNHAICTLEAMKHGKPVYCEKPLCHDVYEVRRIAEAAREFKVATQMGNQGHSSDGLRMQVDWIRSGVIGDVHEVHVTTDRPSWPQGAGHFKKEDQAQPPHGMHWDTWLGPRPVRPYALSKIVDPKTKKEEITGTYHPGRWRGWLDFGCGALGDMAPHLMDSAVWSLNLTGSCTVDIECDGVNDQTYPTWSVVTWRFPERPGIREGKEVALKPCKITWYEGKTAPNKPDGVTWQEWMKYRSGAVFIGDRGVMFGDYTSKPQLASGFAATKGFTQQKRQEWFLPGGPGHHQEFLDAATKPGAPAPMSNFDYASRLTETLLLGTIAQRVGKRIEYDAQAMKITNLPEANQYLRPERRKGWEL
jgi:predicted dehydrogenase